MSGNMTTKGRNSEPGVAVKYSACSKEDDVDLEEIAVVGKEDSALKRKFSTNSDTTHDKDSLSQTPTANGPRSISGSGYFQGFNSPRQRKSTIGERLSSSGGRISTTSIGRISVSSPAYSSRFVEQKSRSNSKNSLIDLFGTRLDKRKSKKSFSLKDSERILLKARSREILTAREIRKQRKKDIEEKFGKKSLRHNDKIETCTNVSDRDGCNWTFVFDPSGRLAYWWSSVVSIAFLYNFWVIIYRYAFQEINTNNIAVWFTLDYTADFLYILDIVFQFRTGYLEDGVLQTDSIKLRIHYMNTTLFYIDCLCLLPLDFLYLSVGFYSILRCFRLVKVYRFWAFLDRTERHTNYPNLMRTFMLMHYLFALFHWNACLYYIVASRLEKTSSAWNLPKSDGYVARQYLHALYWSTLTLTTFGNLPTPHTIKDYLFIIFELILGLLVFATILGHISNIVASISAARKDFQAKLDGVKTYMSLRRVPLRLQDRVIKWFDYLWYCNKSTDEEKTLGLLPDKLKAEIAIHVHLDTLKRVEVFQNTEAGFLCELVLRLKPVLFSPGDYICRKGEVGKEMYIVNRGRLHVVGDNGKTVLATLKPGSYFGEISILNMGTSGNRRTASVRSVGYSDLFRLSKQDLWDVLKEYPAARVKLESIAVKRLEKTNKAPIEKAKMSRSRSTPGLVESVGKIPLEAMVLPRHHTLPSGLLRSNHHNRHSSNEPVHSSSDISTPPPGGGVGEAENGGESGPDHVITMSNDAIIGQSSLQHVEITEMGTMTKSMTASTMASYMHATPPQRSPNVGSEAKFTISPPPSPGVITTLFPGSVPTSNAQFLARSPAGITFGPEVMNQPPTPNQVSPLHLAYQPFLTHPSQQMNFLSPFCASNNLHHPTSQALALTRADNLTSSQTHLASSPHSSQTAHSPFLHSGAVQQISPGLASTIPSVSPASFTYDTSQEVLLQEISSLRERLRSLETENATMSVKLNQQQWNVEHRLNELEMHICQSSSVASTTSQEDRIERLEKVNRESII